MQHSQCRPNINTTLWLGWAQSCAKSSVRVRYTSLRKRQKLGHKKQKWVHDRGKYQNRHSLAIPWINCQSSLMLRGVWKVAKLSNMNHTLSLKPDSNHVVLKPKNSLRLWIIPSTTKIYCFIVFYHCWIVEWNWWTLLLSLLMCNA